MERITVKEVEAILTENKPVNILDVREVSEVKTGKIPGAVNIPLGLLEFRMNELDKSKEYIVVCHSGGRSAQATNFLDYHGYKVMNMTGGMMSWEGNVE